MNGTTGTSSQRHVVVVGAGPAGLLLAGDLAAAGVPVTVVERRPQGISNLTRAFGVHARTLEQLDARDLADELVRTGRTVTALRLFGSLSVDISGLPSRFPYLLVTPQSEVERLLLRRAGKNGATFLYGTEVTGLAQDEARRSTCGTRTGRPGHCGRPTRWAPTECAAPCGRLWDCPSPGARSSSRSSWPMCCWPGSPAPRSH